MRVITGCVLSEIRRSVVLLILSLFCFSTQSQDVTINIHLQGVYESKITLLPLSGPNALKPVHTVEGVKNGETSTLIFPVENLPGEFVIRFDYRETESSTPYPSEKRIITGNQNLELWVSPIYCNNPDSTWFQTDEKENNTYYRFSSENAARRNIVALLQTFLLNYDKTESGFYKQGIEEYETRRNDYNNWIHFQVSNNKSLFVSNIFRFQLIPQISWEGTDADRKQSLRKNYLDIMDFAAPQIVKTSGMKEWMDGYVNLYGELAKSVPMRDSLFTVAGKNAIEKAKKGNPLVYGWMVDYFFKGYESLNIQEGIKMLESYLDDPDCLTSKRQEINRRLDGIKTLVPGTAAPDIKMPDSENKPFILSSYSNKKHVLVLFWSADCIHCKEMTGKLYELFQKPEVQKELDIVAVSIDETDTEVKAWQKKIEEMQGWIHLRAEEGIRSKVAQDYFILSVPVMILIDAETKKITGLPDNTRQLERLIK